MNHLKRENLMSLNLDNLAANDADRTCAAAKLLFCLIPGIRFGRRFTVRSNENNDFVSVVAVASYTFISFHKFLLFKVQWTVVINILYQTSWDKFGLYNRHF